jgi:hypothetical protein
VEFLAQVPPMLIFFFIPLLSVVSLVVAAPFMIRSLFRRAREQRYPTLRAYLRAAPRTDEEKRDAADLALKGLVFCLLGLIFAPVLLFGLIPFFYGARKIVYASMGLGFADPDHGAQ